jgi:LPS export ABC transporter protein LptC
MKIIVTSKLPHVAIIGILGILLFNHCEKEVDNSKQEDQLPDIVLENFSLTETQKGKKLWILNASHALVYDDIIDVENVAIQFCNEKQEVFSVMNAPGGLLNIKTRNILVGDSVIVYTNDSTKLFTDSLFWQNDSQKILTNCPVTILKQDGTIIEGKGLRADPYLKKIEIISETKGISPIELPDIRK